MSKLIIAALFCFLVIAPSAFCQEIEDPTLNTNVKIEDLLNYNKWRNNYKRVYMNDDEHVYRQIVFFENLIKVNKHAKKGKNYEVGLN